MMIADFVLDPVLTAGGDYNREQGRHDAIPQGAYILRGKTQKTD